LQPANRSNTVIIIFTPYRFKAVPALFITITRTLIIMASISEISYSRSVCIAAVRDYYAILTRMYVKESDIIEPPQGGWPAVTAQNLQGLGKSDEMIALLRHFPYIRLHDHQGDDLEGAPKCYFADWQAFASHISLHPEFAVTARVMSEVVDIDNVPPHVIGLAAGGTSISDS
jgi:hypothetical protein